MNLIGQVQTIFTDMSQMPCKEHPEAESLLVFCTRMLEPIQEDSDRRGGGGGGGAEGHRLNFSGISHCEFIN